MTRTAAEILEASARLHCASGYNYTLIRPAEHAQEQKVAVCHVSGSWNMENFECQKISEIQSEYLDLYHFIIMILIRLR